MVFNYDRRIIDSILETKVDRGEDGTKSPMIWPADLTEEERKHWNAYKATEASADGLSDSEFQGMDERVLYEWLINEGGYDPASDDAEID
jgi:hypothetical protein